MKIGYEPLVSIDYLGRKPVYDIEVEGTHNFVAQGILAHNTYAGNETRDSVSSGMAERGASDKGGIDFTSLTAVVQGGVAGMGQVHLSSSSSGLIGGSIGRSRLDCPVNLSSDLIGGSGNDGGQEWRQIERMIKAGIVPSPERIRERLVSSSLSSREEFKEELKQVIVCIAAIMRLEEDQGLKVDSCLEEILRAVESGKPADEIRKALKDIST